ncbi:MAG: glycosyltransferase family 4 protein [Cytophagaceae bacterium]
MIKKRDKITFIYINAYSQVGGLQQYNKNLIHAFDSLNETIDTVVVSFKDKSIDVPSYKHVKFVFANGSVFRFLILAFYHSSFSKKVIFGHVNLIFPLAILLKLFLFKKIVLITHGIDIWRPLSLPIKSSLYFITKVWTVSTYTQRKIVDFYPFLKNKIEILYNTIPDQMLIDVEKASSEYLREFYNIPKENKIILSVSRVTTTEHGKGYDKVLEVLPEILNQQKVTYVLAGKAEEGELFRLKQKVKELGVEQYVVFTNYISDKDLASVYASCDVFVLPSSKEGFGIVFIEALLHGKPVIAGNKDGSVDALQFGETGFLVNPDNKSEISNTVSGVLSGKYQLKGDSRKKTLDKFGFDSFRNQLNILLSQ